MKQITAIQEEKITMIVIEKFFEVLKMFIDLIYNAVCLLLEMNKIVFETILFTKYGRIIFFTFLFVWLVVLFIENRKTITNYIKLYIADMKIIRSELKNYDDISFSLFDKSASYNLKHILPITKERIEYYNYLMDYFAEQEEETE